MATKVEIIVTIPPSGEVKVKTHGLKGADCIEKTKDLEKALGQVKNRQKTTDAGRNVSVSPHVWSARVLKEATEPQRNQSGRAQARAIGGIGSCMPGNPWHRRQY